MLDSVVLLFYLDALGIRKSMEWRLLEKPRAIEAAMPVWRGFREDLRTICDQLEDLTKVCGEAGCPITRVRVLEVLIWMEAEERGYYRKAATVDEAAPE